MMKINMKIWANEFISENRNKSLYWFCHFQLSFEIQKNDLCWPDADDGVKMISQNIENMEK